MKIEKCPFCGGEFEIITGRFVQEPAEPYRGIHMCNALGRQIFTRWCDTEKEVIELINRRAQPENKPLSLDELRQMDGEIVYCIPLNDWAKVTKYGLLFFGTEDYRSWREIEDSYGVLWWALRSKPKEEV